MNQAQREALGCVKRLLALYLAAACIIFILYSIYEVSYARIYNIPAMPSDYFFNIFPWLKSFAAGTADTASRTPLLLFIAAMVIEFIIIGAILLNLTIVIYSLLPWKTMTIVVILVVLAMFFSKFYGRGLANQDIDTRYVYILNGFPDNFGSSNLVNKFSFKEGGKHREVYGFVIKDTANIIYLYAKPKIQGAAPEFIGLNKSLLKTPFSFSDPNYKS